jgi:hypothetical protein
MGTIGPKCEGGLTHCPEPAEVDRHHIHPVYLCAAAGIPADKQTIVLCSGHHDLAHHVLHHLINDGTHGGHRLSAGLHASIERTWLWWQNALLSGH